MVNALSELVAYTPHPRTLTDNGDYVERGGKAPVAFALSDLLDNALAATRENPAAGRERALTVSFLHGPTAADSHIVVSDNGRAMSAATLRQWCVSPAGPCVMCPPPLRLALTPPAPVSRRAVMNFTVADRQRMEGASAAQPAAPVGSLSASAKQRFLNSQLSFFGVGSKNACFYLGNVVKVVTHEAQDEHVHELRIDSAELSARWEAHPETAYQSVMQHRPLGNTSTLGPGELRHAVPLRQWVEEEAGARSSFTRVIISTLTEPVYAACNAEGGMEQLCRELAHVFHYYVHGADGNVQQTPAGDVAGPAAAAAPSAQPNIVVEKWHAASRVFAMPLRSVHDDFETELVRQGASQFTFTVRVPVPVLQAARGRAADAIPAYTEEDAHVFGVIRYYPCLGGQDTMPQDLASSRRAKAARRAAARSAAGGGPSSGDEEEEEHDADENVEEGTFGALFETFWQGRLIPDTLAPPLPFIKAVFAKGRSPQDRDELPDEVRGRLRGQLFFGPALQPTRNKLSFRDYLPSLLEAAEPVRRNLDRDFKEWVKQCHSELDRGTELSKLAAPKVQARLRTELQCENITVFEQATGVLRASPKELLARGDKVLLKEKNTTIAGRVLGFSVDAKLDSSTPVPYACSKGNVLFIQLPEQLHGGGPPRQMALRRIERKLDEGGAQQEEAKEWARAPGSVAIRNNPAWASGLEGLQPFRAGAEDALVPPLDVVVLSGGGKPLKHCHMRGEKHSVVVTQKLLYLGPHLPADSPADSAPPRRSAGGSAYPATVFVEANSRPLAGCLFGFLSNKGTDAAPVMAQAGRYELQLVASYGSKSISLAVPFSVVAGDACELAEIGSPFGGEHGTPLPALRLGTPLAAITARYGDRFGNALLDKLPRDFPKPVVEVAGVAGVSAKVTKIVRDTASGGCVHLRDVVFQGSGHDGMPCFLTAPNAMTAVPATISVCAAGGQRRFTWTQGLLPGLPAALRVLDVGASGFGTEPSGVMRSPAAVVGGQLPRLKVQCLDAWGNPTAPVDARSPGWHLELSGSALPGDAPICLRVDDTGIADTAALHQVVRIHGAGVAEGAPTQLDVRVCCVWDAPHSGAADTDAAGDAVMADATEPAEAGPSAGALPTPPGVDLRVAVTATRVPARFALQARGSLFEAEDQASGPDGAGGGGGGMQSIIRVSGDDMAAGSVLNDLTVALLDASGRSCATTEGVLLVSWLSRTATEAGRGRRNAGAAAAPVERAVTFVQNQALTVPPVTLPTCAAEPASYYLRFKPADTALAPVEAMVEFTSCAAEPTAWHLVARSVPASQGDPSLPDPDAELAAVACEAEFMLCVGARDKFHNQCPDTALGDSMPVISVHDHTGEELALLPADAGDEGAAPSGEWSNGLYNMRVRLRGPAGDINFKAQAPTGTLRPASLTLQLQPGPPAGLALSAAALMAPGEFVPCSTRTVLEKLTVQLVDASGNAVPLTELLPQGGASLEVKLSEAAAPIGDDDDGAAPPAGKSAKVKPLVGSASFMQRKLDATGAAVFGSVCVTCPAPGRYQLEASLVVPQGGHRLSDAAAQAALAKLQPAALELRVVPLNRVTHLGVALLPEGEALVASSTLDAGDTLVCHAYLTTEDGEAVPEDALDGLQVWLQPPSDTATQPVALVHLAEDSDTSMDALPVGVTQVVVFKAPDELTVAGVYTLRAAYEEQRGGLATALRAADRKCDSKPERLTVRPGPPKRVAFMTLNTQDTRLHGVMGGTPKERCLAPSLRLCLHDAYGNQAQAPHNAGLKVRALLPDGGPQLSPDGALELEPPGLDGGAAGLRVPFDKNGRATFEKLSLQEGTGRLPPGRDTATIRLAFSLDPPDAGAGAARQTPGSQRERIASLVVPVDVTTSANKRAELEQRAAQGQKQAAAQQSAKLLRTHQAEATREVQRKEADFLKLAAKALPAALLAKGLPSREELQRALQAEQQAARQDAALASASAAGPSRAAKCGNASGGNSVAKSLQQVLVKKNPHVIGAAAHLGFVQDEQLCRMLSWNIGSRLLTCVVRNEDAMLQLRSDLRKGAFKDAPICPFVCMDYLLPYDNRDMTLEDAAQCYEVPGEAAPARQRKAAWLRAACLETDPPLRLAVPHLEAGGRGGGRGNGSSKRQACVPVGLIGHGVNLIRPAVAGHRRTLWMALIGDVLVFDTIQHAGAYRKWCVSSGVRCPNLVTLDCERVANSGIVDGGKPPPARLADMDAYFATAPSIQAAEEGDGEGGEAAQVAALRQLLAASDALAAQRQKLQALAGGAEDGAEEPAAEGRGQTAKGKRKLAPDGGAGPGVDAYAEDEQAGSSRRRRRGD